MRYIASSLVALCLIQSVLPSSAATLTPLYAFQSFGRTYSGVSLYKGALFGATTTGGSVNDGEIFQLLPPKTSTGPWRFNIVLNFTGYDPSSNCTEGIGSASAAAGTTPYGHPVFDSAGHMFVSAINGGCVSGFGTIVQMSAGERNSWSASAILEFAPPHSQWSDGAFPEDFGGIAIAEDGSLIATTVSGGPSGCQDGTVISAGANLTGTPELLSCFETDAGPFDIADGVTIGKTGAIYAVAREGGPNDAGAVVQIENGSYTLLYQFRGGKDGLTPIGPVVEGGNGALYGAVIGSANTGPMASSIYSLTPNAGRWKFRTIYKFAQLAAPDSYQPSGPLLRDKTGGLWGVANGGDGCGSVYHLSRPTQKGETWTYTRAYVFQCGDDGSTPEGNLAIDGSGALYGATIGAGAAGFGTLFKLVP